MNECPTGCGRARPAGKLMCARCWAEVPADLQREVYRTWRARQRAPRDREALRAYRDAANAAQAAIA